MLKTGELLADTVTQGNLKSIKQLIKKGYTIKQFSGDPVMNAIELGFIHIVKYFLDNGATVNKREALRRAGFNGNLKMFKFLLKRLGMFEKKQGERFLLMCICNHHLDLVKYLVRLNVDNLLNETALHFAVYSGDVSITKYLLAKGLHLERLNYKAFRTSLNNKKDDICFYIIDTALKKETNIKLLNQFLKASAEKGNLDQVKSLINKGASIYLAKKYGAPVIANYFKELFFHKMTQQLSDKDDFKLIKL